MSPVVRHRFPPTSFPHSQGLAVPHSQMLSTIGRPAVSSAARIFAYEAFASCVVLLHQIVFQIIHAPSRVLNGVLIFVTQATGATGARFGAGVGVDTELQSQRMDIVSNHFHTARKSLR